MIKIFISSHTFGQNMYHQEVGDEVTITSDQRFLILRYFMLAKFLGSLAIWFHAHRGLYLCRKAKEKRPLPRSDTSSVHDRGRVKPVCKTSSETGLGKQIVCMLTAELRCNDIQPVVSKWWLAQHGHFEVLHVV